MRNTLAIPCAVLVGLFAWRGARGAPAASTHGATPMKAQDATLAALERKRGRVAAGTAPGGVSPEFFATLVPKDNASNDARIALGRKLYFDTRLSRDGTVACATCHDVERGFSDRRSTAEGIRDKLGRRNSPTTMNALFLSSQFWDGRALTLEEQAKLPIINPIEMGMKDGAAVTAVLAADAEYRTMFQAAYARAPSFDDAARALAAFERTLVFLDAPFDRFARGEARAISEDARAGWALFNGKGRCVACHQISSNNPLGTDGRFHNIGVAARTKNFEKLALEALVALEKDNRKETIDRLALETDLAELGRFVVSRNRADIGAFKTSPVRNVGLTAPYMHDGSLPTLWDVMDHYNKGGEANPYLDGGIEPLALSDGEIDQLVAFMFSLTDINFDAQNRAEEARQRQLARTKRPHRDLDLASRKVLPFERRVGKLAGGTP